jgi:phage repressor protein C with HTH and peptisase S24 domain
VPAANIQDEAIMVLQYRDRRIARKVTKQEDNRLLLQSYDRDFVAERVERRDVLILGRCVRLLRSL